MAIEEVIWACSKDKVVVNTEIIISTCSRLFGVCWIAIRQHLIIDLWLWSYFMLADADCPRHWSPFLLWNARWRIHFSSWLIIQLLASGPQPSVSGKQRWPQIACFVGSSQLLDLESTPARLNGTRKALCCLGWIAGVAYSVIKHMPNMIVVFAQVRSLSHTVCCIIWLKRRP